MASTHTISSREDLARLHENLLFDMMRRERDGLKFKKLNITVKNWKKLKTSRQLRTYWACIRECREAWNKLGNNYTDEQVSDFVKIGNGFYDTMVNPVTGKSTMVPKSIADISDDATSNNLNKLIEFILDFSAMHLEHIVKIKGE